MSLRHFRASKRPSAHLSLVDPQLETGGPAGSWRPEKATRGDQHRPLDRRRPQRIYLAAPIPAFDTPEYDDAFEHLQNLYPTPRHTVLSSRGLFTSTLEWKATYQDKLSSVTGCYVLLFRGLAGYGCKREAQYVEEDLGCPVFAMGRHGSIVPIGKWIPSNNPDPSLAWGVLDPSGKRIR